MLDEKMIFERYAISKRIAHNKISENKCCENCGKFLSLEEIENIYGSDDELLEEGTGKPNGYVLYEGTNAEGRYACIATGLIRQSTNVKTGPMIQIFIINADMHPVEAVKKGKNNVQCFDCIHRPATDEEKEMGKEGGACYVDVGKSVAQVYKAYKKGCYPNICGENIPKAGDTKTYLEQGSDKIRELFTGRKTRFGAYGEPVLLPYKLIELIASVSSGHTGYTHQWKQPIFEKYKSFLMASVDSPMEQKMANQKGWRTFRVSREWDLHEDEMICMNSWQDKTCYECLLCNGATTKPSIIIKVHGKLKTKFKPSSEVLASMGESGDPTEKYDSNNDINPELTNKIMKLSPSQIKQIKKAEDIEKKESEEKQMRREQSKREKSKTRHINPHSPIKIGKIKKDTKEKSKELFKKFSIGED